MLTLTTRNDKVDAVDDETASSEDNDDENAADESNEGVDTSNEAAAGTTGKNKKKMTKK